MKYFITLVACSLSWASVYSQSPSLYELHNYGATITAIDTFSNGDFFVTGACKQIFDANLSPLDKDTLWLKPSITQSNHRGFAARYDSDWNVIWGKIIPSYFGDIDQKKPASSIDQNDNIFITGSVIGSGIANIDFDPNPDTEFLLDAYSSDPFVLKLSGEGDFIHAYTLNMANSNQYGEEILTYKSDSNNYFIAGIYNGDLDMDPLTNNTQGLTYSSTDNIYIAKYDSSHKLLKRNRIHSGGDALLGGISIDNSGNIYITGTVFGNVDFDMRNDGDEFTASIGATDVFVMKYNHNLEYQWAKLFGKNFYNSKGEGIQVSPDGNIIITGLLALPTNVSLYNNESIVLGEYFDIFIQKYTPGGDLLWGNYVKGSTNARDYSYGLTIDSKGNAIVIGAVLGGPNADFNPFETGGEGNIYSNAWAHPIIIMYDKNGNYTWHSVLASENSSQAYTAFARDEKFYIAGVYRTNLISDHITKEDTLVSPVSSSSEYGFLLNYNYTPTIITSLQNFKSAYDFNIYPNPTTSRLNIKSDLKEGMHFFEILNGAGIIVYNGRISKNNHAEINVENWDKGLYIIRMFTSNASVQKKIVIH